MLYSQKSYGVVVPSDSTAIRGRIKAKQLVFVTK